MTQSSEETDNSESCYMEMQENEQPSESWDQNLQNLNAKWLQLAKKDKYKIEIEYKKAKNKGFYGR